MHHGNGLGTQRCERNSTHVTTFTACLYLAPIFFCRHQRFFSASILPLACFCYLTFYHAVEVVGLQWMLCFPYKSLCLVDLRTNIKKKKTFSLSSSTSFLICLSLLKYHEWQNSPSISPALLTTNESFDLVYFRTLNVLQHAIQKTFLWHLFIAHAPFPVSKGKMTKFIIICRPVAHFLFT